MRCRHGQPKLAVGSDQIQGPSTGDIPLSGLQAKGSWPVVPYYNQSSPYQKIFLFTLKLQYNP